jgi:hypothetical protein
MRSSDSIENRLAIRELCELFAAAVMRADAAMWGSCWDEDGVWHMRPGLSVRGRDQLVARWTEAMSALRFCSFIGFPSGVTIDRDRASGSYFRQETLYFKNGDTRAIVGRYDDSYVKRNGVWLLAERTGAPLDNEIITKAGDPA